MADRRRRRKVTGSGDSDEVSESSEDENPEEQNKPQESAAEIVPEKVVGESEYESAEEEDEEDEEDCESDHTQGALDPDAENPADEEGGQEETADVLEDDFAEGGDDWKDGQREEGDGEESEIEHSKEKPLDFDEDRRNPQYIPKKGGFYEHDDRLSEVVAVQESENAVEESTEKKKVNKKLWKDDGKWNHDRYHETEQNPKSSNELITTYGYDIRNEEGPPHARRRRRYGRGPSKYTRKWENEDAYSNSISNKDKERDENSERGNFRGRRGSRGRGGRGRDKVSVNRDGEFDQEDFPRLESKVVESTTITKSGENKVDNSNRNGDNVINEESVRNTGETLNRNSSNDGLRSQPRPIRGRNRFGRKPWNKKFSSTNVESSTFHQGQQTALVDSMKDLNCNDANEGEDDTKVPSKDRRRGTKAESNQVITSSTYERHQATIPPRLQDAAANKPKRYSSQRQRTTAENSSGSGFQSNTASNSSVPPRFYDQCYQQSMYPERSNSSRNQSGNAMMSSQSYQGYEPPYPDSFGMRPITNSPRMYSPVSMTAGQPVISTPYVASGGNMMGYGPPQSAYTQFPFQPYPPPPPSNTASTVGDPHDNTLSAMHSSPPQEIFRGGMAYYNTQPPVRTVPKRPRAAIPIVPPPDMEGNNRSSANDYTEENVRLSEENGTEENVREN